MITKILSVTFVLSSQALLSSAQLCHQVSMTHYTFRDGFPEQGVHVTASHWKWTGPSRPITTHMAVDRMGYC